MQQICKQCEQKKDITAFYRNTSYSSGHESCCKTCRRDANALWLAQNPGYLQRYHEANKVEKNAKKRAERLTHGDAIRAGERAMRHGPRRARILAKERAQHHRHKAVRNAKRRARYYANHVHSLMMARSYASTHKDARRLRDQQNPHIAQLNNARRKARILAAPLNDFTLQEWQAMKEHYGHRCVYCGRKMQRLTMDHITPLSKGGSHTLANIVPACQGCNSSKHTGKPPVPVQPLLLVVA